MAPAPELTRAWTDTGTKLLLDALASTPDADLDAASGLPGWTRRHLVAHVAANADALRNLVAWARTGTETPMYPSPEQRARDIEAGARRPVVQLRRRVDQAAADLAADLDTLTPAQWGQPVRTAQGRIVPATEVPWLRAREVCVHAVDLDVGIGFADLPREFVAALLDDVAAKRSRSGTEPALVLEPVDGPRTWRVEGVGDPVRVRGSLAALAAYATGRPAPDLAGPGAAPELPPWL